jgi:hypothetical protein
MPRCLLLSLAALALLPASAPAAAWREITFSRTVQAADRAALDAAGAVHPSGARSYLLYASSRTAERLAARPGVRSVRRVRAAEKLASGLRPGATLASVVRYAQGRRISEIARLDAALTPAALARRADVLLVGTVPLRMHPEDEGSAQLQAGNHTEGKPKPGYEEWLEGVGVNGTGSRIAVVDTGLDATHPDLASAVVDRIDYEFPVATPLDVDEQGHGTHVAGIIAGNPDTEGLQAFQDDAGFYFGLGVAPGAELVAMNGISLVAPDLVPFIPTLTRDAVRSGAFAWNASWHTGEGTGAGYIETVRTIDSLARDADRETPGNQPLTMVFSAGNEGPNEKTITVPKEAKNIIAVGASKGQRASGSTEEMADFSSRGPGIDGRILPLITAPGEAISSARSKPAGGLCFEPATGGTSPIHSNCSGTSMASPHVAGAVALIGQWWRGFNGGKNPSTAMTRALLVNSATDLDERDVPNGNEGWGRVNVGALFGTPPSDRVNADQTDLMTDPGASRVLHVAPVDSTKPLRVTLAWTDAPGAAAADDEAKKRPALVNDLDLTVTGPDGSVYAGNVFAEGHSVAGGHLDRLNNLENVLLDQAGPGPFTVTVAAAALPGDGLPGTGDTTDQDYALAIANARIVEAPAAALAAPATTPAALPKLTLKARQAGRRLKLTLRSSAPLSGLRATLRRGRRTVATGRLKTLSGRAALTLKLPRGARGKLALTVTGRAADGRAVKVRRTLRVR